MKIKVSQLKPNPFRDIKNYPIDKLKVENLISSIKQTGFWDNILAREINGCIEIAYGHHRLEALKTTFPKNYEVDIPVKKLDDPTMLRIMANENMEQWGSSFAVILETIKAVKIYLDTELSKYETWETSNENIRCLFESQRAYTETKTKGVGQTTILKFLGEPWTQFKIAKALQVIKDETLNDEAFKTFNSISDAGYFKEAVEKINKERQNPINFDEQIKLAEKVKTRIEEKKKQKTALGQNKLSRKNVISTITRQEADRTDEFTATMKDIEVDLKRIEQETRSLNALIMKMNERLGDMGVQTLQSMVAAFAIQEFSELQTSLKVLLDYFGFSTKKIEKQ